MPKIISITEIGNKKDSFKVLIGPFGSSLGHVMGNSLRRILLSSIPGAAVTEVYIDNCLHEYATLEGVREDVVEVLLRIKNLAINITGDVEEVDLHIKKSGSGVLTVNDIESNENVQIFYPEYILAHLNDDADINIRLHVRKGYGFVSANVDEVSEAPGAAIGSIGLDASFNPVLDVSFTVLDAEEACDSSENLSMFIKTKGNIAVEEAIEITMIHLHEQLSVFIDLDNNSNGDNEQDSTAVDPILMSQVEDLNLTIRSANCLRTQNIRYLGELVQVTESDLMLIPNLGRKSFNEIKEALSDKELSLGMVIKNWLPKN